MKTGCWIASLGAIALTVLPVGAAHATSTAPVPYEAMLAEGGYGGFLDAHPDLRHYRYALAAYLDADYTTAMRHFRKAARYSDKPSQALIAEMLWEGQGVPRDRALAYAWMDLAAERGSRRFLIQRERYWNALDEAERADAVARGAAIYAEFGDDVAQGRLVRTMRRASLELAGSRTGFGGNVTIHAATAGSFGAPVPVAAAGGDAAVQSSQSLPAVSFFAPQFWKSQQYFAWRDGYWERQVTTGLVEVGEVEQVGDRAESERGD